MAVKRPTPSQLRSVAEDLGMTLTDEDITSFFDLAGESFAAYDTIDCRRALGAGGRGDRPPTLLTAWSAGARRLLPPPCRRPLAP
jgi:hypothetical protein